MIIKISGIIYGGKNNLVVTRTGHRYPNATWEKWRDSKIYEVKQQLRKHPDFETIDYPCGVEIHYTKGDNRRRDLPAILDSLWHLMEKCNVVTDDTLLGGKFLIFHVHDLDKKNAGVEIFIREEI